jgi:hypothetical protein
MATLSRGVKNGNGAKERGRGDDFEQSLLLLFLFFSFLPFYSLPQRRRFIMAKKNGNNGCIARRERERE